MTAIDPTAGADASDRSVEHLLGRLDVVRARVRVAVERRRAPDAAPDDRFRGLYVSESDVDALLAAGRTTPWQPAADAERLLASVEARADESAAAGEPSRLRRLAETFGLDATDVEILLVAVAPDIDPRFERLYGYLHDDVTRRRASVGLALELSGVGSADADGRARLAPAGQLIAGGLLGVDEAERPLLTRALRVPDRISAHLLGDESIEPALADLVVDAALAEVAHWPALENALRSGISPLYLRERTGTSAAAIAHASLTSVGRGALVVDLARLPAGGEGRLIGELLREARLRDAVLVAVDVDALGERALAVVRLLVDGPSDVVLAGARAWDPAWSRAVPLLLSVPLPGASERAAQWAAALNGHGADTDTLHATLAFRLTPQQVARAAQAAQLAARAERRDIGPADVHAGARAQNAAGLDRLAHHRTPSADWHDLVLPPSVVTQLRELTARVRHRERVFEDWQVGGRATRGRGITALFAGDSGTGKTLASEVIAGELGLDLYVIDLSTVIDKYIGETEKNLDRIFAEADRVNGVLLFDEADAIFGKRSEVRDARDRYANVEVAYLLQRMERFDGLAVLTTNLRANLDDAFTRRIDVIVDFPMPDDDDRLALWQMHLPPALPQSDDIDLAFMAGRFRFSGGNIRNACLTAAFLAAEANRALAMADLVRGTEREYRKLGRLTVEDEFGPYLGLMAADSGRA
ncbi:ATP-binding protein [soil metagenome]